MEIMKSENTHVKLVDRFLANSLIKSGSGFGIGSITSFLIFKRKMWPITFGTAYGFGFACSDYNKDLYDRTKTRS